MEQCCIPHKRCIPHTKSQSQWGKQHRMHDHIQDMFLVWRSIFQGDLEFSPSSAAGGDALSVPLHTDVLIPSLGESKGPAVYRKTGVTVVALYPSEDIQKSDSKTNSLNVLFPAQAIPLEPFLSNSINKYMPRLLNCFYKFLWCLILY